MEQKQPVGLDGILSLLKKITKSEDLRWLSRYVAIKADLRPDLRGIRFTQHRLSATLKDLVDLVDQLEVAELITLYKLINLLWEALRPKPMKGRGVVEIKTVSRDY